MPLSRRRSFIHYSLFPPNMRPLFYGTLLYSIADQMVGVFLPLFLFSIGKSLHPFVSLGVTPFVSGVLFTAMYYGLQRFVMLIGAFPLARLMYKLGYVWSMTVGIVSLFCNFIGLYLAKQDPRYLVVSFVFGGINLIMYWVAHDSLFAHEVRLKEIGRGIGAIEFLIKLIQIAVPAVSGIVIVAFGYSSLFIVGMLFLLLSMFPLFFVPTIGHVSLPTVKQFFSWLREGRYQKFAFVQFGKYMDVVAILLWPIYVLVFVGGVERVGFIFSIALFLSLVLTYVTGWFVDHRKGRKFFVASGSLVSLSWFLRLFVRGVWDIVGLEFLEKLAGSIYTPCYDSFLCRRSKGKTEFAFILYKEILLSISAIVLWTAVFVLFLLPMSWTSIFLLGAVGVFLSLFLDAKK